jgi:hypothetical protein
LSWYAWLASKPHAIIFDPLARPNSETLCADTNKNATPGGRQAFRVPPIPDRKTGHAAPEPFYEPLINSNMVAEVL